MGTEKRERKKSQRAARLQAEQAAKAAERRKKTIRNAVVAGVVIVVIMLLISLTSCSSSESKVETGSTAPAGAQSEDDGKDESAAPPECPATDGSAERKIDFTEPQPQCIDPAKTYTAAIETTEGTVTLELDTERTPGTVNNFVTLARWGYYDNTVLFRTEAPTGIIQGGSPHTQSNADPGPGYTIADEGLPFTAEDYAPGVIAMANTGAPNSGSAQFFFVANEGGSYLGQYGTYPVFGRTTEGLDVLQAIAQLDNGSGKPSKEVSILKVTITES